MFEKKIEKNIIFYTSPLFARLGIRHAFFTRFGGVSTGDFESLNVSTARINSAGLTDSPENVEENYRRGLAVLGIKPENACSAKQVHSATVRFAEYGDAGKGILASSGVLPDCDGVVARKNSPVHTACVKTADCVPILMANLRTGDVCAVHAGWRGTVADIASVAANSLSNGNPSDVAVAIGPCIGRCCYEIGDEVYARFSTLFRFKRQNYDLTTIFSLIPTCSLGGSRHLDLARANAEILEMCGVLPENIDAAGICTCCFAENGTNPFFSHRASGGHSGTFLSAVSAV